jgi:hypothetical protein
LVWVLIALGISGAADAVPNLVSNGDFEAGNSLFSSDYDFSPASNTAEGQYTVRSDPFPWNANFISAADHTSGTGLMFVGNGAPVDAKVWFSSSPIPVTPDTDYFFEAWVMNVCCKAGFPGSNNGTTPVNPATLSFYANDVLLGTRTTSSLGAWEPLSTTWDSDVATSVTLRLVNANLIAQGNDFAVDDIFLGTESSIPGSVPEPGTSALLASSFAILAWMLCRRAPRSVPDRRR